LLQWVEGRCLSYGTSIPYLLWLDVLRGLLGVTADDSSAAVRERLEAYVRLLCADRYGDVYPYLAWLASVPVDEKTEACLEDMQGAALREGTFAAVETLLRSAAEERPLVVVCEDLHWADTTSLALLKRLLALTVRSAVLFVCVFRPDKAHGSYQIQQAAQGCGGRHTDLWLEPLTPDESGVLVGNLLSESGPPTALLDQILGRAEGNPFYVEELIHSLIDQGVLAYDEAAGVWELGQDLAEVSVPETLQGVLMARIDRLAEETKRVLQMAAVIGRVFLYRVLAAIAAAERELDGRLARLEEQDLIRERSRIPELEYIFKHELTREAAYNGLLRRERRAFHGQVAQALETLFPERTGEQAGLLAHHWERAGDAEKAAAYLQRAGDRARFVYAHPEAISYYERALTLLTKERKLEQAARTWMKLGLTHHGAFNFRQAREAYNEGFSMWQQAGALQPAAPPPQAPHAFRLAGFEPGTLDPCRAGDADSFEVTGRLFSGLVERSPDVDVVPEVARRWDVLDGGRTYLFHLREDMRWSDGAPVTAGDFEYAIRQTLHPTCGSRVADYLYDVKGGKAYHHGEVADPSQVGVRALDDTTLMIELERPTSFFLHLLAISKPVPRHVVEARGEAWTELDSIVTNGPFRPVSWEQGESMVLERSPTYRGRFAGNVRRVELGFHVDQPAGPLQMYETGGLDMLDFDGVPPAEWNRVRQRHAGEYVSGPIRWTRYVGFDVTRPPFGDRRVRRAFTLAADREALADQALGGFVSPAAGGLVPPGMPGHSPGIGLPYGPERARQLLAQAGYPGGRGFPPVEAVAPSGPSAGVVVDHLRTQWLRDLGVEITWKSMEWGRYVDRLDRETLAPHLWLMGWGASYDPDGFMRFGEWRRTGGWRNEAYDALVEGARQVMDQGERMRMYQEADRILVDEAPVLLCNYARFHLLVKPWVTKFPISDTGDWFWKDIVIEPH
jgi:ABC-type oligopeptide transport system substrate-binding subunit